MRYLLDTCVISDFIKGETGTTARLKQTPPVDIAISAITVMELRYGLALNPQLGISFCDARLQNKVRSAAWDLPIPDTVRSPPMPATLPVEHWLNRLCPKYSCLHRDGAIANS
jgi:hypothetical protein